MVELKGVSKTYKSKKGVETKALDNINLKIDGNGLVFIIGRSGSGKSTLLNLLGGLDSPDTGSINIDDENICKFNDKKLDSYRNSYVGFVFQEFNLLEEFNVFDNINLSLKLQGINDNSRVNDVLKSVDLDNLGNRNINELSGGQKQRVSIARALVKKPKLILADEPTGNLDKKSSDQIFKLLKEISKNELIIVVSHDIESAQEFADRIIKLEDGKIVSDNKKKSESKNEKTSLKKSKLPFNYMFKMAYLNIMSKPIRLVLTILLTMIALSFMAFTINVYLFDDDKLLLNTVKNNEFYNFKIEKYNVEIEDETRLEKLIKLDSDDIKYIENNSNSKSNNVYSLYEDGSNLSFKFGRVNEELIENDAYNILPSNYKFVLLNDNRIIKKIIGSLPINDDEIVVHKYFADCIINHGIYDLNDELFKASNYNEILNKEVKLNNHIVRIVGIVDDDNKLFERSFKTGNFWSSNLKQYYNENYSSKAAYIYVTSGFINNISLTNNVNVNNMKLTYNDIENDSSIKIVNNKINYYDLNGNIKETNSINNNEIIVSVDFLRNIYSSFNDNLEDYLKKNSNMVYNEIIKKYTIEFIKKNDLRNINLKLENDDNSIMLKMIGVSLDSNNYLGSTISDNMNNSKKEIISSIIYNDNNDDLEKIFDNFEVVYDKDYFQPGTKYRISFNNSFKVSNVIYVYERIGRFLFNFSLMFILFAILVMLNFISNSILNYRKQIGILRSIGTTKNDVIKIIGCETIIINIISWIFGILMWIGECMISNESLFGSEYFTLNGILLNSSVPIILLLFVIIVSSMITIIQIDKISRLRPIDVILNK